MANYLPTNGTMDKLIERLYNEQMLTVNQYRFLKTLCEKDWYLVYKYLKMAANLSLVPSPWMSAIKHYDIPMLSDIGTENEVPSKLIILLARRAIKKYREDMTYYEYTAVKWVYGKTYKINEIREMSEYLRYWLAEYEAGIRKIESNRKCYCGDCFQCDIYFDERNRLMENLNEAVAMEYMNPDEYMEYCG